MKLFTIEPEKKFESSRSCPEGSPCKRGISFVSLKILDPVFFLLSKKICIYCIIVTACHIALDWNSPGLHLVQQVRDEAHRFAQRYHHKLREKRVSGSILEEAPGIGKKRRQALLTTFGSYDKIREASLEFLSMVDGMTEKAAKDLREWLDKEDPL